MATEQRWNAGDAGPYTYVAAVLPSSTVASSVVFGGSSQGGGPVRALENQNAGAPSTEILIEGDPIGTIAGLVRADTTLLIFIETGSTLDIYAVAR